MQRLLNGNVKKKADGSTEIRVDASMVRDSTDTAHVAGDLRDQEVVRSMDMANELVKLLDRSGLSATVTVEGGTGANTFKDKLDMLCTLLLEGRAKNHGFLEVPC